MSWRNFKGTLAGAACALALGAGAAQAAAPEPEYVVDEATMSFEGTCGLVVDDSGLLYASEYYGSTVDVFNFPPPPVDPLMAQISNVDPDDGPCGLALDGSGRLYVNDYHRRVERYVPAIYPLVKNTPYGPPTLIDSSHPTGVGVDQLAGTVYVNARTHLNAYDSTGAPVMDGPDPLKVGIGSLGDAYGLAVSAYPATVGRIYVPDHSDDTLKVYDPAVDKDDPVQVIAGPPGGFGSLRDSAVAVDRISGEIYVADTRAYPQYTEVPEAVIRVFAPDGSYLGRLKYGIVDASPPGLAVDNSLRPTQGRVYVTSGNGYGAKIIAYPRGAATGESAPPVGMSGKSTAFQDPALGRGASSPAAAAGTHRPAVASPSVIAEKGTLRVSVSGKLTPKRLPRQGTAPISVSVGGEITTTDESMPPQLKKIQIELNRGGKLDTEGLPLCRYSAIQPGSSGRALAACKDSLVGQGSFTADITLAGQEPYPTGGKMLLFHSVEKGKPVLYGHIYSDKPFATSFVIVFAVQKVAKGTYGIALNAPLPPAMDAWGRLTGLQMTLQRRYSHRGEAHSFLSAGCPAPKGFTGAVFPLARTEFAFDGGKKLRSTLTSQCKVRG
jgi:hypothetical protein